MPDILFVNMPWSGVNIPSLGLALLTSILREQGLEAETYYGNLHFSELLHRHFDDIDDLQPFDCDDGVDRLARFIKQEYYSRDLVDEYIFSSHKLTPGGEQDAAYWRVFTEHEENRYAVDLWQEARKVVAPFLDEALAEVQRHDCKIIGFTSMFGQNVASLLLAERIKQAMPDSTIVFGGANCEGDMGGAILRNFTQVDYVVCGEAEITAPMLLRRIIDGETAQDIPGVIWRDDASDYQHNGFGLPFDDLDTLPFPDYQCYYDAVARTSYRDSVKPTVFLEQSRGCWWGQKHHCTFCGLNSHGMGYRKKSDDRCFDELDRFARTYPSKLIHFADNILDMKKFGGFMQRVAEADLGLSLFFEIKSNISKERLKSLSEADVYSVQPGIENFSDRVLTEMRKGVSGLQNVQCLKWGKQYGMEVIWNLLYGFPGEVPEDFQKNLDVMKSITHLDRHQCVEKIIMQRFSPNYDDAAALGFRNVRPWKTYPYVYDLPGDELMQISYSFDYDYAREPHIADALAELKAFSDEWGACRDPGDITYMPLQDGGAIIVDTRFNMPRNVLRLDAHENQILIYLDRIRTSKNIVSYAESCDWDAGRDVMDFVKSLQAQRFAISEGERFLGVISLPDSVGRAGAAQQAA